MAELINTYLGRSDLQRRVKKSKARSELVERPSPPHQWTSQRGNTQTARKTPTAFCLTSL